MDIRSLIGVNVRKLRRQKGWSQEDLAFKAEMDRSYLSEIESGQKNLSIIILEQMARALNVDIKLFFEGYK